MKFGILLSAFMLLELISITVTAAVSRSGETVVVSSDNYTITFSAIDGSIVAVSQAGKAVPIIKGGEQGLWYVRFRDSTEVNSSNFRAGSTDWSFKYEIKAAANLLRMVFHSSDIKVTVDIKGGLNHLDFAAEVSPTKKTVLDFALPGRIRFDPDKLSRFIFPMNGNFSVGAAFNSAFFKLQPQNKPSGWRHQAVGPKGYIALYGGPLDQREDHDPATTLRVTDEGRRWFSAGLVERLEGAKAVVNRPPTRAQADIVLADSPNGPYFSASHLGGAGFIWRIGGAVGDREKQKAADMVMSVINKLANSLTTNRNKLGIISLKIGPDRGSWTSISVREWLDRFHRCPAVMANKARVVELTTPQKMIDAMNASDFFAILNPYGEWTPVLEGKGMEATVDAVKRYVRAGGNWFEVGGYPFYYEMRPIRYLHIETSYPAGFADFFHLDTNVGSVSIYGVQPQKWMPWDGAKNKAAIFVPGRLSCGGDEQGGYCDRPFGTYIAPGTIWRSPTVRLTIGKSAEDDLLAYCEANEIKRRLEDKMSPDLLKKFKESVLVYYGGICKEKIKYLKLLPVPSQIHFADYLKGGFDKQYPDHLPPRSSFGTPEEFREFFDRCHELGHLVMPYTNPTWWCDHPKGPTFEREGNAPLLKTLDGKLSYERYNANDGFTVCHWHPAVQAANRKTLRQFTNQYPVDILFQDQCGARGWRYDTNPASPTPYAYSDGLISMIAEDCKTKPLSTEAGWDRVVNYESQLCGMSWTIVPTEGGPSWRRMMKYNYPPETWEIFPLAQYIAHDKTAMLYHDLGQFVTNRKVIAWTLGLGFCMSYRTAAASLMKDPTHEWLKWLDRLQKSVCAHYVGEPVKAFKHDRGPLPTVKDDGVLRAIYGHVKVIANIGPVPRTEANHQLPPYGFYVTGPGFIAANLKKVNDNEFGNDGISFVVEGNEQKVEVWVYAPQEQEVCVELPAGMMGDVSVVFDDGRAMRKTVTGSTLSFRLPRRVNQRRVEPPPTLAGKAPRDWPGERPAIGILDMRDGAGMVWTRITPAAWLQAFQDSRLSKEFGLPIKRITTVRELIADLKAGPRAWFAIINPYGEGFPAAAPGKWRDMLDMIRHYVNNGGCWWETGGYSLYQAFSPNDGGWRSEYIGPWGMGYIGIPVGGGDVDQPAESLSVTHEGRKWLGDELSGRVEKAISMVNRGLTRGSDDPGHTALVAGRQQDFIGGYRMNGWGWFWRIGGFWPNPNVALPVTVAAMDYIYTHPPLPMKAGGVKYLWHVIVKSG